MKTILIIFDTTLNELTIFNNERKDFSFVENKKKRTHYSIRRINIHTQINLSVQHPLYQLCSIYAHCAAVAIYYFFCSLSLSFMITNVSRNVYNTSGVRIEWCVCLEFVCLRAVQLYDGTTIWLYYLKQWIIIESFYFHSVLIAFYTQYAKTGTKLKITFTFLLICRCNNHNPIFFHINCQQLTAFSLVYSYFSEDP